MEFLGYLIGPIAAGAQTAEVAKKKGYDQTVWFVAGLNILGLLIILFLPNLNKHEEYSEQTRNKRMKAGNTTGAVLAGFSVILIFVILALLAT